MISAMRSTFRKKNRILNTSYSLDKLMDEESNHNFYDIFEDNTNVIIIGKPSGTDTTIIVTHKVKASNK